MTDAFQRLAWYEQNFATCKRWGLLQLAKELGAAQTWQPIATAPHGCWILVADLFGIGAWQACWSAKEQKWCRLDGVMVHDPTHWMPLPSPPK